MSFDGFFSLHFHLYWFVHSLCSFLSHLHLLPSFALSILCVYPFEGFVQKAGWCLSGVCVCVLSWLRLSVWSFISKKHHNMTAVCEIEVTQNRNVWWNGFYPHFFQAGVKLVKDGLPSDQHLGKLWHKVSVLWFILILIGICVVPSNVFPCNFFADHTCFGNKSPIGWLFFFACDI